MNNNFEVVNQYLTNFSFILRQTFENSEKQAIPISSELRYIENYVQLENLRFGRQFEFIVEIQPDIDPDKTYLPPMFIQPHIENSIHHGLMKQTVPGFIKLLIESTDDYLILTVEDNGIGREMSARINKTNLPSHLSGFTKLNAERIRTLNDYYSEHMTLTIKDLSSSENKSTGTRVTINFPKSLLKKLSPHDSYDHS